MNIISYCLFGSRSKEIERWEFLAYLRGFVFNVKMNALLFPGWVTHIELDSQTYSDYDVLFKELKKYYNISFDINASAPLCKAMLWRLKPIFFEDSHYVMCRDCDSLTSYRERQAIEAFTLSGLFIHGLTDNPAHTVPLLGGLCSFSALQLRTKYKSWDELLSLSTIGISSRGTDQSFLNSVIYPDFKESMFAHYLKGMKGNGEAIVKTEIENIHLNINNNLWESNLCSFFAGSAGVNELETLRFFKRFEPKNGFEEIEKQYPKIFYWYD